MTRDTYLPTEGNGTRIERAQLGLRRLTDRLALILAGPLVQGYFSVITEIFDDSGRPHTLVRGPAAASVDIAEA